MDEVVRGSALISRSAPDSVDPWYGGGGHESKRSPLLGERALNDWIFEEAPEVYGVIPTLVAENEHYKNYFLVGRDGRGWLVEAYVTFTF